MAKYRLANWERNGYHDSDWFDCLYDDQTGEITTVEVGSTRYAGGPAPIEYTPLNDEVLEQCRVLLEQYIFDTIRAAEHRDVLAPNKIEKGARVRLIEDHRNKEREETSEPCRKCGGSGNWVNPRNSQDVRECFGCSGTGQRKRSNAKKGGKFITYKAGSAGVVVWVGTFRTIYSNGYNRLGRETLSTKIQLDSGVLINAPLNKLRLDKEPMSDEELRDRARDLSYHYNFLRMGGCTAWGDNYAAGYAAKRAQETGSTINPALA